ncbi:hypothetical protein [Priestia megaterium]|uniref:hypothetical protein n=1 Tax=Priestia megaterium TaxID=1404 RepID=UPI003EE8D616
MRPRRSVSDEEADRPGRPRKAKPCTEINSGVTSNSYELIYPICSSFNGINLDMS